MSKNALNKAIQYFGSQAALANAIGVKNQTISYWLIDNKIPYQHSLKIFYMTQGKVSLDDLNSQEKELNELLQKLVTEDFKKITFKSAPEVNDYTNGAGNSHYPKSRGQSMSNKNQKNILDQFWRSCAQEIKKIGTSPFLLALYLQTTKHAHASGIYFIPLAYMSADTGISEEKIKSALTKLIDANFCSFDELNDFIWVHDMALSYRNHIMKVKDIDMRAMHAYLATLPTVSFMENFYQKYDQLFSLGTYYPHDVN